MARRIERDLEEEAARWRSLVQRAPTNDQAAYVEGALERLLIISKNMREDVQRSKVLAGFKKEGDGGREGPESPS